MMACSRIPIPAIHTRIILFGCEYFKFQIHGQSIIECVECRMRNLYREHTNNYYHFCNCSHWHSVETLSELESTGILLDYVSSSVSIREFPPAYQEIEQPPPPPYTP